MNVRTTGVRLLVLVSPLMNTTLVQAHCEAALLKDEVMQGHHGPPPESKSKSDSALVAVSAANPEISTTDLKLVETALRRAGLPYAQLGFESYLAAGLELWIKQEPQRLHVLIRARQSAVRKRGPWDLWVDRATGHVRAVDNK